jgi:cytidine deaminase
MNNSENTILSNALWMELSRRAWDVRSNASIFGKTQVGAALLSQKDQIFCGCNLEHRFRSHDIHAEVNAISNMVTAGELKFKAILIVAERYRFTPCGSCMDWIMQHGGSDCIVAYQNSPDGPITRFRADELMPYYPE